MKESIPTFLHNYKSAPLSYMVDEKHITSNNINCIIHYSLWELFPKREFSQWCQSGRSSRDSDTGKNDRSNQYKVFRSEGGREGGREGEDTVRVCSVHEAMSCPAFPVKGALTVHPATIRLNRPLLLKMCQRASWEEERSPRGETRWGKKGQHEGEKKEPEGEKGNRRNRAKRASCRLNSGRLFKARACSWLGTELIKDAGWERANDAKGGEVCTELAGENSNIIFKSQNWSEQHGEWNAQVLLSRNVFLLFRLKQSPTETWGIITHMSRGRGVWLNTLPIEKGAGEIILSLMD